MNNSSSTKKRHRLNFDVEPDFEAKVRVQAKRWSVKTNAVIQRAVDHANARKWTHEEKALLKTIAEGNSQILNLLGLVIMRQGSSISHNLRTIVVDPQGRLYRQFNDNLWTPRQLAEAIVEAARLWNAPGLRPANVMRNGRERFVRSLGRSEVDGYA
jgi:hypothetical protein